MAIMNNGRLEQYEMISIARFNSVAKLQICEEPVARKVAAWMGESELHPELHTSVQTAATARLFISTGYCDCVSFATRVVQPNHIFVRRCGAMTAEMSTSTLRQRAIEPTVWSQDTPEQVPLRRDVQECASIWGITLVGRERIRGSFDG